MRSLPPERRYRDGGSNYFSHPVNQVQKFVNVVSKVPYDVDMVSGRYTINAKSLLGIYSLDLNRPLQVVMYSDDCEALKKELEEFMR